MINPIDPGWLRISDALSGQEERPRRDFGKSGKRKKAEKPLLEQEQENAKHGERKDRGKNEEQSTIDIVA